MVALGSQSTVSTTASLLPTAADVRYVAGTSAGLTGSDSNSGLSANVPFATIQAAYDDLPDEGGTLILLNGRHNVGTGFVGVTKKPAVMTSITGYVPNYAPPQVLATSYAGMPMIYGSGATLIKVNSGNPAGIANGWAWLGLGFDMSTSGNLAGIWAEDLNWGRVRGCIAEATHSEAAFLLKTTSPLYDDCSQWRIEDNHVRNVGLCTMNDGVTDGNCNNNQVLNNCIFGGIPNDYAVKMWNANRCLIMGNELGMNVTNGFVRFLGVARYNHTLWNGGEGHFGPFIRYDSPSAALNVHFNYGATGGEADGSETNVSDLAMANSATANSLNLDRATAYVHGTETGDFTLAQIEWHNGTKDVTKATAVTATIPPHASAPMSVGTNIRIRQGGAGQVTIAPGAGVTLQSAAGLKTRAQYSVVYLQKILVNTWAVWGDTTT